MAKAKIHYVMGIGIETVCGLDRGGVESTRDFDEVTCAKCSTKGAADRKAQGWHPQAGKPESFVE